VDVPHLPATATAEEVAAALDHAGAAVVDRLVDAGTVAAVLDEAQPLIDAARPGGDDFAGHNTRRIGSLIERCPRIRDLVMHPLVLGTVDAVLPEKKSAFQLHLTQLICIGPGEPAQTVHRDQWAWDFFPFPAGYEVQCNTMWALTDFTEENGATRVVPGSHRWDDKLRLAEKDTVPAEMDAGSVLFYVGSVYHGGGANRSDAFRVGANLTYTLGWLRQEENQYLACSQEVARTLPEDLLRLMGYARGAYALGYVGDIRDPLEVLLGRRPEERQRIPSFSVAEE
jgi:ectoine hydroxylase-related dioxygenase (phytanoyl-CoA dioxygenase family)